MGTRKVDGTRVQTRSRPVVPSTPRGGDGTVGLGSDYSRRESDPRPADPSPEAEGSRTTAKLRTHRV
jgi:hypothetical protein